MTVEEKVAKGVKLLTKKYGDEWRSKVNLDKLNMYDSRCCILGQTDSDYYSHCKDLGINNPNAYGFEIDDFNEDATEEQYKVLEREWRRALKRPSASSSCS